MKYLIMYMHTSKKVFKILYYIYSVIKKNNYLQKKNTTGF